MSPDEKKSKPVDRSRLMLLGALSAASLGGACIQAEGGDKGYFTRKEEERRRAQSLPMPDRDSGGGDGGGGGGGGGHSH